jgi:branched-chain amino acid transport system permease protein
MDVSGLLFQLLNGLAGASSLFLVAAGLSLIFGVTRVVNFAHGSFFMLGIYLAYTLVDRFAGTLGYWTALILAAGLVGVLGAVLECLVMRRIYQAPELFQLLATFALVLVIQDAVLWFWGPEELLGPRAPGLKGAVELLGRSFPQYDLLLILLGPVLLVGLWLLLTKTRWGILIRAATQDREMVAALGVNQAWLFTAVFFLGALLAGLGGALQLPREPASLSLDLSTIAAAFVVVVVGGMGSIPGAYLAALLISEVKALFIWLGVVQIFGMQLSFTKLTLVVEFLVMAIVLVARPWGLLGRPLVLSRQGAAQERPLLPSSLPQQVVYLVLFAVLLFLPWAIEARSYLFVLGIDLLIAALFATSLHFMMGPAGLHSFGHAAYFGLGAYGAALLVRHAGLPMELALALAPFAAMAGAAVFGWLCVRLSGVYLAMLTLAFAQIVWAVVFQWDDMTGGSNGLTGIWPSSVLSAKNTYYVLTLVLVSACLWLMRRALFSPFGLSMRAARDSSLRADAIGLNVKRIQWLVFVIAASFAGLAGALFAFSKGSISPEVLAVGRSVDALVMVLLGGVQTLAGPAVGAISFTWLQETVARNTGFWRAVLGGIILLLVLLFPKGIAGYVEQWSHWLRQILGRRA